MPNACFRCKVGIDSGETFCRDCRGDVSLDFSYTGNSRLWVLVAAVPVLQVLFVLGRIVWAAVFTGGQVLWAGLGASFLAIPLSIVFGVVLLYDVRHVRRRDDTAWNPSDWTYLPLVAASVIVVFVPFVAAYHLYRREQAIGLSLSRTSD